MTWPLAIDLAHQVPDPGIPYFVAWILHWDWFAIHSHRSLFEANIFYPSHLSLLFSENLLGVAVLGFPLFAAGAEPIFVENVLLLAGIFLMGFSAWLLAYEITHDRSASLLAGVVYAFAPYRSATLQFFQLQWAGFLPLIFLFLRRFFATRRWRDLVFFTFLLSWNGLVCVNYELVALWGVAVTVAMEAFFLERAAIASSLAKTGLGVCVSAILLAPVYLSYAEVARAYDFRRDLADIRARSPGVAAFLTGGLANRLRFMNHSSYPEWQLFPGAIPLLIVAAGIFTSGRFRPSSDDRPAKTTGALWATGMIAAGILMAVGPHTIVYGGLYRLFPTVFGSIRDSARGFVLTLLGIGVLASMALTRAILPRFRKNKAIAATVVAVFALAEFTAAPLNLSHVSIGKSPFSDWLATHQQAGAILELPMKTQDNIEYVFRSTEHGHPIVNGYSGFYPADFVALTRAVAGAKAFAELTPLISNRGIRLLAYHPRRAAREEARHLTALLSSGTQSRLIEPLRFFRGKREEVLVFELAERGRFSLADSESRTERVAAHEIADRLFSNPELLPPSPDALAFAWPDFY
jgi:hypothetical protein